MIPPLPACQDGSPTLVDDEQWYEEAERLHSNAEALAMTRLDHLLSWAANTYEAPRLVDWVIANLGIPSPDRHPSGAGIPGSVCRKILYHAHVEGLVRRQRGDIERSL